MSKLIVEVDEILHKKLGDRARSESKTIKEIVTRLAEKFLSGEDEPEERHMIQPSEPMPESEPTWPEIDRRQEDDRRQKKYRSIFW